MSSTVDSNYIIILTENYDAIFFKIQVNVFD